MKKFFENVRKLSTSSSSQSNSHLRRLSLSSVSSMPQIKVLRGGYNIDLQKVDHSFTKLHKAVYLNNEDRVKKYLSQYGVNSVDNHNRTPLHFAAVNGNIRIIKMLILSGANVNIQDADGRTPLIKAIECECNDEVVRIMLDSGAKLDLADYDKGNTALHHCLLNANLDCALYIIRNALIIDYNKRNHRKETFLHLAAKILDLYPVIEELIANGIEIEAKDELGRTAAQVAKLHNNHDAEELIKKYVNAQQNQQQRSLNNDDDDDDILNDGHEQKTIANGKMFDDQHNPDADEDDDHLSPIIYDNIDRNLIKQNQIASRLNKNPNDLTSSSSQSSSSASHNKNSYKLNTIDGSLDWNFRNHYRFSGFFEDAIIEENNSNDKVNNEDDVKQNSGDPTMDAMDNSSLADNDEPLYSNCDQSSVSNSANNRKQTDKPDENRINQNKSERSESIMDFISDNMSDLDEMLNKDLNNAIEIKSSIEFDNNNIMIDIDLKNEDYFTGRYYPNNIGIDAIDGQPSTNQKSKAKENNSPKTAYKESSQDQKSRHNSFELPKQTYNVDGGSQSNSLIENKLDSAKEQEPIRTIGNNNNANMANKNIEQLKEASSEPITITNHNNNNINQIEQQKPAKSYAEVLASPKKNSLQPIMEPGKFSSNNNAINSNNTNNTTTNNNNLIEEKNLRMKKNGKFSKKGSSKRNNNSNNNFNNNHNHNGKNGNKSKMMAAMMVRNTTTTTNNTTTNHENTNPQNHQPMIMNINNVGQHHHYTMMNNGTNNSQINDMNDTGGQKLQLNQNDNDVINGINVDNDEILINYATKDDINNIFLSANQSKSILDSANCKSRAHDQSFSLVSSSSPSSSTPPPPMPSSSASKSLATPEAAAAASQIPDPSFSSSSSSSSSPSSNSSKRSKRLKTKKIGLNATAAAALAASAAVATTSATNHLQNNDDDGDDNNQSINNERAQNKNIQPAAASASIQWNKDHNHNSSNNTKYINLVNSLKHLLSERMFMMGLDPKQNNNNNNNDDAILFKCISKMFYEIKQYQTNLEQKSKDIETLKITVDCLQKQLEQERSYAKDLEKRLTKNKKTSTKFQNGIENNNNNKSSSSPSSSTSNDSKILIELLKEQHQLKLKHYETILNEQLDENFALKKQCHFLKELIQIYEMSNRNQQEQQQQQQQQKCLNKDCMQQFQDEIDTLKFFTSQLLNKTGVGSKSNDSDSIDGGGGGDNNIEWFMPSPSIIVKQFRRHSEQIKNIDHIGGQNQKQKQQKQQQQQGTPQPSLRSTPSMKLSSKMKSFSLQDLASIDTDYYKQGKNDEMLLLAEQSSLLNNRGYHTTDGRTTTSDNNHQQTPNANIDYSNSFSYKSKYFQSKINELRKQLGYVN